MRNKARIFCNLKPFPPLPKTGSCIIALSLVLLLLNSACSTLSDTDEGKSFSLKYKSKTVLGNIPKDFILDHPIQISKSEIYNHLLSIWYEPLTLMAKPKRVFSGQEAKKITPSLAKALNGITSVDVAMLRVESDDGPIQVYVFSALGRLHWKFTTIKGIEYSTHPIAGRRGINWKMVPQASQYLFANKKFMLKDIQDNWLVAEFQLPKASPTFKKKKGKGKSKKGDQVQRKRSSRRSVSKSRSSNIPQGKSMDPELEKKLEFLKDLHKKGLIDDTEFKQKRKELVDEFF